jgi:hypothetical protein
MMITRTGLMQRALPMQDNFIYLHRQALLYQAIPMKSWDDYYTEQREICAKYKVDWMEVDQNLFLGLADNITSNKIPVNGLRHLPQGTTCGWYIWSGQEIPNKDDYFKPVCVKHLLELKPDIIKFLGLPPGYRFLTDDKGYVDIWEDKGLLNV